MDLEVTGTKTLKLNIYYYSAVLFALITVSLGVVTIVGWITHNIDLIVFKANTTAMVFNTALCFIIAGLGVLFVLNSKTFLVYLGSGLMMVIALLELMQFIFNIDLKIDQLVVTHYYSGQTEYPGRMAPNSALFFLFTVSILILNIVPTKTNNGLKLGFILGLFECYFAILSVSGYYTWLTTAYIWNINTPMALNTAFGFLSLSLGLIAMTLYRTTVEKVNIYKNISYLISFILIIDTLLFYNEVSASVHIAQAYLYLPFVALVGGIGISIIVGVLIQFAQNTKTAEKKAKLNAALNLAILEATENGFLAYNRLENTITYNQKFLKLWEFKSETIDEMSIVELSQLLESRIINISDFHNKLSIFDKISTVSYQTTLNLKNNKVLLCTENPQWLENQLIGKVLSFHDMTAVKRLEKEIRHQSMHDLLTGLPNKTLLMELLDYSLGMAKQSQIKFALSILDLDRYARINDAFGHSFGDKLLCLIVKRLKKGLSHNLTLCRMDADEFAIIINKFEGDHTLKAMHDEFMACFNKPFELEGHKIFITSSMGISLYHDSIESVDDLIKNAYLAMEHAKRQENNAYVIYSHQMSETSLQKIRMEHDLIEALDSKQFVLHYQPYYNLSTLELAGFEALIRWQHPRLGLVYPDKFVPIAEDLGLIDKIGVWIIQEACEQLQQWNYKLFKNFTMSINVSTPQFKNKHFSNAIKSIIDSAKISTQVLELEITESILLEDSQDIYQLMHELRELGVGIALDDFGKGYSSLSYLKRFPITKLKIDQGFINDLIESKENQSLVKAIIAMGFSLNMLVQAEGIENEQQLKFLQSQRCDLGQGYYFSKPMDADKATKFFTRYTKKMEQRIITSKQ